MAAPNLPSYSWLPRQIPDKSRTPPQSGNVLAQESIRERRSVNLQLPSDKGIGWGYMPCPEGLRCEPPVAAQIHIRAEFGSWCLAGPVLARATPSGVLAGVRCFGTLALKSSWIGPLSCSIDPRFHFITVSRFVRTHPARSVRSRLN